MDAKTLETINKLVNVATSDNPSESESAVRGALGRMKKHGISFEEYLEAVDPKSVFQYGVVRVADKYVQERDDLSIPDKRDLYARILSRITERFSGKVSSGYTPEEIAERIVRGVREARERERKAEEAEAAKAAFRDAERRRSEAAAAERARARESASAERARAREASERAERHAAARRKYDGFTRNASVAFFFGIAVALPAFFGATFFLKGPDLLIPFYAVAVPAMLWKLARG